MFYTPCAITWDGEKHIVLILYESGEIEESIFKFDEYGKDRKNGYSIEDVKDISELFNNIFI